MNHRPGLLSLASLAVTVSIAAAAAAQSIDPSVVVKPVSLVEARMPGAEKYEGGAASLELFVRNKAASSIATTLAFGRPGLHGTTDVSTKTFPLSPGVTTKFIEPISPPACEPVVYTAQLTAPAAQVDTRAREVAVVPNCVFSTAVTDPWWKLSPDRVESSKKSTVYVDGVVVSSPYACGKIFEVRAKAHNTTAAPQEVKLELRGGLAIKSEPVVVAAGKTQDVVVRLTARGLESHMTVGLVGAAAAAQSVAIDVTRTCNVKVVLRDR